MTQIDEYFDLEYFNEKNPIVIHPDFRLGLVESRAAISGSSVLEALRGNPYYRNASPHYHAPDIDIYVQRKYASLLISRVKSLKFGKSRVRNITRCYATPYDSSFFKRNNILERVSFRYRRDIPNVYNHTDFDVDIMIVADDEQNDDTVTDVVSNFDLSCCENWVRIGEDNRYDVFSTSYAETLQGVCRLSNEYLSTFLAGNKFIKKRIEKYRRRGFKVIITGDGQVTQQFEKREMLGVTSLSTVISFDSIDPSQPIEDCSKDITFTMGVPFRNNTNIDEFYDQLKDRFTIAIFEKYGCCLNNMMSYNAEHVLSLPWNFVGGRNHIYESSMNAMKSNSLPLKQLDDYSTYVDNSRFEMLSVEDSVDYLEECYRKFVNNRFQNQDDFNLYGNVPKFVSYGTDDVYYERSFLHFMFKPVREFIHIKTQRSNGMGYNAIQEPYIWSPGYNRTLVMHWFNSLSIEYNYEFNVKVEEIIQKMSGKPNGSVTHDFGQDIVELWRIADNGDITQDSPSETALAFYENCADLDTNVLPNVTTESIRSFVRTVNETYRKLSKLVLAEDIMDEINDAIVLEHSIDIRIDDRYDAGVGCSHRACDDDGIINMEDVANQNYELPEDASGYDDIVFLRRNREDRNRFQIAAIMTKQQLYYKMRNKDDSNVLMVCPSNATGEQFSFTWDQVGRFNAQTYVTISTDVGEYLIDHNDAKYLIRCPSGKTRGQRYDHKFFLLEDFETRRMRLINATLVAKPYDTFNILEGEINAVSAVHCDERSYTVCRMIECNTPDEFDKVDIAVPEAEAGVPIEERLLEDYPALVDVMTPSTETLEAAIEVESELITERFQEELFRDPSADELKQEILDSLNNIIRKKRIRKLLTTQIPFKGDDRAAAQQLLQQPAIEISVDQETYVAKCSSRYIKVVRMHAPSRFRRGEFRCPARVKTPTYEIKLEITVATDIPIEQYMITQIQDADPLGLGGKDFYITDLDTDEDVTDQNVLDGRVNFENLAVSVDESEEDAPRILVADPPESAIGFGWL